MRALRALLLGCFLALLATPVYAVFGDVHTLEQNLQDAGASPALDLFLRQLSVRSAGSFRDVDATSWYAPYVAAMVRRSIVSGDTDASGVPTGTFRPSHFVTIAESLKIVLRAAQVHEQQCTGVPVNLLARTHWARQFVACAEGLHVRLLTPTVSLDNAITRAELLGLIDDVFGDLPTQTLATFRDVVDHPYGDDISYNAAIGIVSGDTDAKGRPTGFFRPDDPIRRSEIAKILTLKMQKAGL